MNKGRYLWATLLILGLYLGLPLLFLSAPEAILVATLDTGAWRKVEDIVVCAEASAISQGEAWGAAVGPELSDDLRLFHIINVNTPQPQIVTEHDILFLDQRLGGSFPPGMGPRGTAGIDVDDGCRFAYVPNFFPNTVMKVDLQASVAQSRPVIVWEVPVASKPVDVQLVRPHNQWLLVANWNSNKITVLDAQTGSIVQELSSGGQGPISLASGGDWAFAVNSSTEHIACLDLRDLPGSVRVFTNTIPEIASSGYQAVTDGLARVYVSNFIGDTVIVFKRESCTLDVVAAIPVGDGPRYLALSSDGNTLYVSHAFRVGNEDNTKGVSMIDTASLEAMRIIEVAGPTEPPPLGIITLSKDDRYLMAYWEGGVRGSPGKSLIYHYAVKAR